MQRVLIIGSCGSGKSTVAATLAQALDLPLVHLDAVYWQSGWRKPSKEAWQTLLEQMLSQERWILDGNYDGSLPMRLAVCDTVVFLDLPRWLCLFRVIKRRFQYRKRSRPDMAEGCPEQLSLWMLKWVWRYPSAVRPKVLQHLASLTNAQKVYRLRTRGEVVRFLKEVSRQGRHA